LNLKLTLSLLFIFISIFSFSQEVNTRVKPFDLSNYVLKIVKHKDYFGADSVFNQMLIEFEDLLIRYEKTESIQNRTYLVAKSEYGNLISNQDVEKGISILQENIELCEKYQFFHEQAMARNKLGSIYLDREEIKLALNEFLQTAEIFKKHNDWNAYGYSTIDIGNIYYASFLYPRAIEYYQQSIKILETHTKNLDQLGGLAVCYQNIGLCQVQQKKYTEALISLKRSLNYRIKSHQIGNLSYAYNTIALVFIDKNEIDSAEYYFSKALTYARKFDKNEKLMNVLIQYAQFKHETKKYPQALEILNESYAIALKNNDLYYLSNIAKDLGKNYLALMQADSAEKYLNESISTSILNQDKKMEETSLGLLLVLLKNENRLEEALKVYAKLFDIKDYWLKNNESKHQLELEIKARDTEKQLYKRDTHRQKLLNYFLIVIITLVITVTLLIWLGKKRINKQAKNLEIALSEINKIKIHQDQTYSLIAHDLKGPMGSVIGLLDIMNEDKAIQHEELIEYNKLIYKRLHELYLLLNNLISWASVDKIDKLYTPRKLNIEDLLQQNIQLLNKSISDKGIEIIMAKSETSTVFSDENMLSAIFRNLLSNAIKFSHPNGRIDLTISSDQNNVLVTIADYGIGMNEQQIQQIKQNNQLASTRGTAKESGIGIGLSIIYRFIKHCGGQIDLQSEVNQGTKWIVSLQKENKPN
jgi:signal transduction histidine kinase